MRRLSIGFAGCAAVVLIAAWPSATPPQLPLVVPAAATTPLLAVASTGNGSRIEQLDPATFTALRVSATVGWYDGWVASPDRALLALATHSDSSNSDLSTIRFANASTLKWVRRGVQLDGYLMGAIWPRAGTLYALASNCCGSGGTLDTVDTVGKRIVARTTIRGQIVTVARSADGLVYLSTADNALAPATLAVIGPDGSVRSVQLTRIIAGTHFDQTSQDPIGTTRQPGLAVDPATDTAYVLDDDGLVAQIGLHDLTVLYHQLDNSLIDRLSAWLTPPAAAKGINGPILSAQWLGDGLITLTGTNQSAVKHKDGSLTFSSTPAGLRVIDTNTWNERTLDPGANNTVIADGLLLASGGSWRSDGNTTTSSGEGLAAYSPDETLRWRINPGWTIAILAAYGSRALIQTIDTGTVAVQKPVQLLDLENGHILRTLPPDSYPWPLLGTGS